jgi:thioredoxin reductase (NADPH)
MTFENEKETKINFFIQPIKKESELEKHWDIIIIGAGPAGLSAALYSARAKKKVLVIEKNGAPGGQISTTGLVEDYPGIESITGPELSLAWAKHAEKFGASILYSTEVYGIDFNKKTVMTSNGDFEYKKLIIATGAIWKELNIKGERELRGKGVSYCAVCDGPFFKDKNIIVVGGGNSALDEALYLAKNFAKTVTIVHRRDTFKADKILQERVMKEKNIKILFNTEVKEIIGKEKVEGVLLFNNKTNETYKMQIDGVFIFIGLLPNTAMFELRKDENGYIITDEFMRTNIKDVFAVGDCRKSPLKQAINAASDGSLAGYFASREIDEEERKS